MSSPEAELWQALRSDAAADITRQGAWIDLFLQLAQGRIEALMQALQDWQATPEMVLPFSVLSTTGELAGLCAEQASPDMAELARQLNLAAQRASAAATVPEQRQKLVQAAQELMRQMHQHAAGVKVSTPAHILQAVQGV